jgi:hypothetical protein
MLPQAAEAGVGDAARKLGIWCAEQMVSYGAGKAIDWGIGQLLGTQVEQEIPSLVDLISLATGERRKLLQETLELDREQLGMLTRLTISQGKKIAQIQVDQERLSGRIQGLNSRISQLEKKVGRLDARVGEVESRLGGAEGRLGEVETRVSKLEDAFIRECLDLRTSQVLGADEFRIKESPGSWITDHFEDEHLTLDALLLLNSCSGDLTQRGLLLQLSLVTRDLDKDMSLYANFKGISSNGGQMRLLSRQEIPLARPAYKVDGQVMEIFFPYDEIPDLTPTDRIALALVLTHDGEVLYTLPDRPISCVFGQRINCRWR